MGRDVLNPCLACTGAQCSSLKKAAALCNVTPTSVYLVTFGSEIKVGVSIRERIIKRWVEQGADWGVEVGFGPNGSIARLIEDEVSQSIGISKLARLAKKLESIGRTEPEPPELGRLASRCFDLASSKYPDFRQGDTGPIDLQPRYNLKISRTPAKFDVSRAGQIKGEFLGMKGPIFMFQSEIPYAVDFRALRGRLVGQESDSEQLKLVAFT
jgi:hypothetical protein